MKYECKITSAAIDSIPVMNIEGDLTSDADIKPVFEEIQKNFSCDKLIINFDKTKYINSSGIAHLINIIQNVNDKNGTIAFVGMSQHFQKVMDIVGITDFVNLYGTNKEAVERLGK
jgi:anti-anti-sigma factor